MTTIYRGSMTTLWVTLQSNEELGILDSDYVEDYFGNDGQISLYHIASDTYFPVVLVPVPGQTPSIPNDVFTGSYDLTLLPDGAYEMRGRVKDVIGNYTIIGSVQTPIGGEGTQVITFSITSESPVLYTIQVGFLKLTAGINTGATLGIPVIQANLEFNYEITS